MIDIKFLIISLIIIICQSKLNVNSRRKVLVLDGKMDLVGSKILQDNNFDVCYMSNNELIQIPDLLPNYDVLVIRSATKVNANLLKNCEYPSSKLRLIARAGVGLDNVDLSMVADKKIGVINTPNANSRSVAEMVFAHIFTLSRCLHLSNRDFTLNPSSFFNLKKEYGQHSFELYKKKIGIIGAGNIGKEVARIAIAMGMEILIHDYKGRDIEIEMSSVHPKLQDIKISLSSQPLSSVLSFSDIITIHTPGTTEVIGNKEMMMIKKGCTLINCARGGVVNEKALVEAVSIGNIKHVGLDVFEDEPPIQDASSFDLIKNPLVCKSPHIGAATKEAQTRVAIEVANGIINFFKNQNVKGNL